MPNFWKGSMPSRNFFLDPKFFLDQEVFLTQKKISDLKFFSEQNFFRNINFFRPKNFFGPEIFWTRCFLEPKFFRPKIFFRLNIFCRPKMNFMKDDLWREKTELLNLRLSKLARAKIFTLTGVWHLRPSLVISIFDHRYNQIFNQYLENICNSGQYLRNIREIFIHYLDN